jgi:feruloyl esterase
VNKHSLALSLFLLLGSTVSAQTTNNKPAAPDETDCANLAGAGNPLWSIKSAEFVQPPLSIAARRGTQGKISVETPFCRVTGRVTLNARSEIDFELWLPRRHDWNGKFAGVGSGASRGTIEYQALMRALARGYAAVATDSGHQSTLGFDVSWALGQPDRVIDFGYRAQHTVTQAAKVLTAKFYGRAPRHSYFVGCSQGGHHALMEAERFPADYDGIVAGAPVYSWTNEMTGQVWNLRALQQTPAGALPVAKLQLLYDSVAKTCAGADGLIDDPRHCSFDPSVLQCTATNEGSCLTNGEVEAVRTMYQGPRTPAGKQIYPGLSRGGEIGWDRLWSNPGQLGGSGLGFYRFVVFQNPSWDLATMDFARDSALAKQEFGKILDPDNPDLSGFAKSGGKMIVYHGWADDMVPSQVSIDYYDSVTSRMGATRINGFYRLFMVPGMLHCGGGPGADVLFRSEAATAVPLAPDRDMLTALEQWVEHGRAPSSFVASRLDKDGTIQRTRLLCPSPATAKYRGAGDVMGAENYACSLDR